MSDGAQKTFSNLEDLQYVGSTHWSAMLDDIRELKTVLENHLSNDITSKLAAIDPASYKHETLFGSPRHYSLADIIDQWLPEKSQLDRYIGAHFSGEHVIIPFIHLLLGRLSRRRTWGKPRTPSLP